MYFVYFRPMAEHRPPSLAPATQMDTEFDASTDSSPGSFRLTDSSDGNLCILRSRSPNQRTQSSQACKSPGTGEETHLRDRQWLCKAKLRDTCSRWPQTGKNNTMNMHSANRWSPCGDALDDDVSNRRSFCRDRQSRPRWDCAASLAQHPRPITNRHRQPSHVNHLVCPRLAVTDRARLGARTKRRRP